MTTLFTLTVFFLLLFPIEAGYAASMKVFVSILPQKYFVERIGGSLVDVSVMVLPGANPATYEPKPRQMVELSRAKVYFSIGVPFEKTWLPPIAQMNKGLMVIHTDAGIAKRHMESALLIFEKHEGTKEEDHGHEPGSPDPHIWLPPPLVMLEARNILAGLIKTDPEHRESYETGYKKFITEIVSLDLEIINLFQGYEGSGRFMVFHPSWGYFAEAYGLTQLPIETEGKEPRPSDLKTIITEARKENIKVIFVQPQFSRKSAETIAHAIGAEVFTADPLAEDWAGNLKQVALRFREVIK
jgi:zinc transport system substrate-binding protein